MSVSYETFLPEVLPYARDCPQAFALNAIRNAAIEFCDRSHWLQHEPDPQALIPNQSIYEIETDTGVEPIRLVWTKINGHKVGATMNRDFTITVPVKPATREPNALEMKVAVKPTRSSTTVDDTLYNRWVEGIAAGALSRLLATPAQPFTDADRAMAYTIKFNSAIADARIEVERELTVGPTMVKMRRFL